MKNDSIKPGDKCTIIKSCCGDEGMIVLVTSFFNGGYWGPRYDDNGLIGYFVDCDVIIQTMGSKLHSIRESDGRIAEHLERPYISKWLRKLPEVDDEEEEIERQLVPLFYPENL